jgi:predicted Zn-dependent peptidase
MERIRSLVHKELRKLWEQPLGPVALSQAKRQLIGQLTLSHEHLLNQMLGMAKDVLEFGQIIPFRQHIEEIEALTAPLLQEAAVETFRESPLSLITYHAS